MIVRVCRVWAAAFLGTGELCWPLSTGEVLKGAVHPAWRAKQGWRPQKLTILDPHQAYKQFPISSACQALGVIALRTRKVPASGSLGARLRLCLLATCLFCALTACRACSGAKVWRLASSGLTFSTTSL